MNGWPRTRPTSLRTNSTISGQPTSASDRMKPAVPSGRVNSTSMIARSSCGIAVTPAAMMRTHLRERATVPAGHKTEDEPDGQTHERRGEHDRERQSCSAEDA